jgi:cation:H+ antiporter
VLGLDLESTAAGVAATLDDLPGTALGSSIGASILLMTLGLGLAGLVAPFRVRPPAPMLSAALGAAVLCAVLAADGALTRLDGALLLAAFPLLVAVLLHALRAERPAEREAAARGSLLVPVLLAVAGVVVGAELLVWGTGRVVGETGIDETTFGLLVVAAAVSLEELVIEMLPAYRGFPELSVGNALGTLIFLCTGSLGVIALVRPVAVPSAVTELHLPALVASAIIAVALLARGRIGRGEGALLCALYALYVGLAVAAA